MDDVLTLTNEKRRKETRVSYVSSIHGSTTDEKKEKKGKDNSSYTAVTL